MTTHQELAALQQAVTATLTGNGCTAVEWRNGNSSYRIPYRLTYTGPDGKGVTVNIGKSRSWAIHFLRGVTALDSSRKGEQ